MKSDKKMTLDDLVFENRNKDYGSYKLRKQYWIRLVIGFTSSLAFILVLVFGYFWFLSSAGDATIYLYPSSSTYLKTTTGSLLTPEEIAAYQNNAGPSEKPPADQPVDQTTDQPHSFKVVENASPDTFKPEPEVNQAVTENPGPGLINDSTAFGGILSGNGNGAGGIFDRIPEFPGGDATKYVERNLRYPLLAIRQNIHGIVIVSFIINKTGQVVDVKVERGVDPIIDEEAVKTIKNMPPWKPGMMHGRPINFLFRMPINFVPLS